ncbi:AcrR family transcriptional regulator [Pedobacter sp. CG_S7]|uniref:TetR/AcrR family transcriptional regulator n=1 Tax=Pedobacter sp. CG_S7 TaxID=3143930 RepID=UPI0033911B12
MDKKKELIIEGAIKRFIHYGINKTTMNEIADDLSVSKPSLYYYFPDKGSLIQGVINKVFDDYYDLLSKEKPENCLEDKLAGIIDIRHRFFQKYYMMHLSFGSSDASFNTEELKKLLILKKKKDIEYYGVLLQKAMDLGEIEAGDSLNLAELYLQSLSGITFICIMHGNKELMPTKKELKLLHEKQQQLSKIFIKGLKN